MKIRFDELLSSLRAYLTAYLIDKNIPKKEIATILGITPSSISHYIKGRRGKIKKKFLETFENDLEVKIMLKSFINDTIKRRELGITSEYYLINLAYEIYSHLESSKVSEEIKKAKYKIESVKKLLRDRINLEMDASKRCLKMVNLTKDDFLKLILRSIASDSIRHAEILSLILSKIEGKVEISFEKLSKEFLKEMLNIEEESKEEMLKDIIENDHPLTKVLLLSIDIDEEKHAKIIKEMLKIYETF